jgi:protein-disulfide isomerase
MKPRAIEIVRFPRAAVLAIAGLAGLFLTSAQASEHATVFGDRETRAIEAIITDYLMEKPELIMRALEALREREVTSKAEKSQLALQESRDALERDPQTPVGGNREGDVTVVEFFDYRCPYCKRSAPQVAALVQTDGNVRLVYKEWPILGPESVFAARAALAAHRQGKYIEFHDLVMGQQRFTEASVIAAAGTVGLDIEQLRVDMQAPGVGAYLDENMRLARSLGITGTPAFIIGDQLVRGAATLERMQALVAETRSRAAAGK